MSALFDQDITTSRNTRKALLPLLAGDGCTHRVRTDLCILALHLVFLRPRDINHSINYRMRHMHALWPKLPSQTLCQRFQGEFPSGESGEQSTTFHGCRSAGEDQSRRMGDIAGADIVEQERENRLREIVGATSVASPDVSTLILKPLHNLQCKGEERRQKLRLTLESPTPPRIPLPTTRGKAS